MARFADHVAGARIASSSQSTILGVSKSRLIGDGREEALPDALWNVEQVFQSWAVFRYPRPYRQAEFCP